MDTQAAQAELAERSAQAAQADLARFVEEHPLGWLDKLAAAVDACEPQGYVSCPLALARAILQTLV